MSKYAYEDERLRISKPEKQNVDGYTYWVFTSFNRDLSEYTTYLLDPRVLVHGFKPIEMVRAFAIAYVRTRTSLAPMNPDVGALWLGWHHTGIGREEAIRNMLRRLRLCA